MNNVCVFCGSGKGLVPEYLIAAEELGKVLLENNLNLVQLFWDHTLD